MDLWFAVRIALLGCAFAAAGCAQTQEPVSFSVPEDQQATIDDLVRALAESGHSAARIDEPAGVVYTDWEDTGFRYGHVDDDEATIVRRYVGTVSDGGAEASVSIRADARRCAPDHFTFDGYVLEGRCEAMDGLVSSHQDALDELGERVRAALGAH